MIGVFVIEDRAFNKKLHFLPVDSVDNLVQSWHGETLVICGGVGEPLLKRLILDEECLWLEGIDQLLAEVDALLACVLAPEEYHKLLGLLVLHYEDPILEVKVNKHVLGRLEVEGLQRLLLELFSLDFLEEI